MATKRDILPPVKGFHHPLIGAVTCALIVLTVVLSGCNTTPTPTPKVDTPPPETPEPSLPRIGPADAGFDTLPPPSVKLVDLRRLRIGMTKEEVLSIFPGPEKRELSPRDTTVWHYEFAELYFRDGRLYNWFDLEQGY